MDRAQEKGLSSKAKLQQTFDQVHENQASIIGINRVAQRKISTESSTDNLAYIEGRNGIEGVNSRKTEPLMQSYLHANTPGAGMGVPYMTNPNMDPRALGFFYGYNPQLIGFPGYPGIYGQRLSNGEDMRENRSSTNPQADRPDSTREPKEPVRTESVIKIATDRPDSRKQEHIMDKRQSRPVIDEYTRQYTDRNGESESSRNKNIYRGSRDKMDAPLTSPNGDVRNTTSKQMPDTSSADRTIGTFSSYPTPSVYSKSLTPVPHPGDYNPKADYSKTVTTSSNMYASMPKLTPIAPRGFSSPNFPATSAGEVIERHSLSGSVWRPSSMGYLSRDYPLSSASEALTSHRSSSGENSSRTEENPESRGSYLPHPAHESGSRPQENFASRERPFQYSWDRSVAAEISPRYPGHSAYQGYGYGRTFQPKRTSEKENFKEMEDVRSRTSDSVKESSISPDRTSAPRYAKDASKVPIVERNKSPKEQSSQNYKSTVTSQQDVSSRIQANLSKTEKPVVPENARYKVKDERKCVLKSDKVTVYPRQGMAYVVSVRETPQKVSDYFSNGRLPNAEVTTVASDSKERDELTSTYEAASKKDEGQRHATIREGAGKTTEKIVSESTPGGEYQRRTLDSANNDRSISVEDTKKINDRNNNSSFTGFQYPGYPSQSDRSRASNRITLSQDKVFVPPNATLEMFEKRELEMERAAASCRSGDAARSGQFGSNVRQKQPGRKDNEVEIRNHSPEQTNPRVSSGKPENKSSRSDGSIKSSDDEELKIIEDKNDSQQRSVRPEEKRLSSSPRIPRITSPASTTTSSSNPPYLTPFGVSFPPRRTPSEADAAARENAERSFQAAAYMYGANMPYQTNSPYLGSNVRPDMPVMLPMDQAMFYSGLYKQHMMDPTQGGAVMQDPLTGSLVVVPEALLNPNMFSSGLAAAAAAESQLMLDPARFWGMQASMEDPRWQQLIQQQKQLYEHELEKYKREMMIAQQQGRWPGYPVYPFYQKQMDAQRKEENERSLRNAEQRPKSREEQSTQPRADKNEDSVHKDKKPNATEERFFANSRRDELENRRDTSKMTPEFQGEARGVASYPEKLEKVPVREPVKQPLKEYSETKDKTKEKMQQEEQDRQFQQYMLKEPMFTPSKFPFTRIPTSLSISSPNPKSPLEVSRDRVRDVRDNTRGESTPNSETSRAEMSPQVVSAAATLANMDFGTRFPFNQQSPMQLETSKMSRGNEHLEGASKRSNTSQNIPRDEHAIYQPPSIGKSPTDKRPPQPTVNGPPQLSSHTKPVNAVTIAPSTVHEHQALSTDSSNSISEKGHFDYFKSSFVKESARTKSSSTSSQSSTKGEGHEECSQLLVAKAEKLPQDEELEVIRIDTPYVCTRADNSKVNRQETDLLMSMSKSLNDSIESPSSKSEIFWVACSDEELEDLEVRTINSSVKPMESEIEGHNKENYFKFSLQNTKSEDEKKCIREKIEKLREVAKSRTREERFTALTRQKEMKSPASIVNSVTSSLNEVLDMNVMEKDIRMRLADLQKKYREKHRELARLQPRCKEGNDELGGGKNTPVKRGPGRPRKRKYFGASSRSGKTTPTLTANGSVDLTTKSGASSPSSCPQSPGLKSVTSEDNPTIKDEPTKKKRKKSSTSKVEERVPTLPSPPQIASPTEVELKPPRVKLAKKPPTFPTKSKVSTTIISTISTTTSNMAKLISAISPSMLDDSSNMETESESSTTDFKTMPAKTKPKKTKKFIKREKLSTTDDSIEDKDKISPESRKEICGSPTSTKIKKVKNPKKAKKKEKPTTTAPRMETAFVFPVKSEKVVEKPVIKEEFPKAVVLEVEKKVEKENNGDSSENDEVFMGSRGGGALDMLADFASSARFEKEKQPDRESPFEGKGSKRGRPKKPYSPTPESDTTPTPKKKKKKKKPSTSSTKSSKKSSTTSEEKENDFTSREVEQQSPTQISQEKPDLKEQPKPEVLEEQIEKVPEIREEVEDEEPEEAALEAELVTPPEPIKEKRRKSRSSSVKELDENKPSFALFGDWQPRRSERIFINSSVAPPATADTSPLSSPTLKSSDFGWPKKTKRLSKGKKLSKTDSVSDVEPTEDEAPPTSSKPAIKPKKKKSPAKGKKRRSSSTTDPDFVLRTPKRKAAKRDVSYEEADEDDDEDMADEEDEDYHEEMEADTEEASKEIQDETQEGSQPNKPENELADAADSEMNDEEVDDKTALATSSDGAGKCDDVSAGNKESVVELSLENEDKKSGFEATKESQKVAEKEKASLNKDEEHKPESAKESQEERIEDEKETWPKKENEKKEEEEKASNAAAKKEMLPCVEDTITERGDQSSSDELASITEEKKELPPEPVISFTKEELKENCKMLLPVDRVFYRGRIDFYQDPDLYGIVLPGERGRRPHLRSTEQLLSQAVKDVIPPAVEYLPVGTRVCAHWSPQYRCFYPGSVIETPPDEKSEVGKLWVEFDDGDSGIFPLSDLRKIKTQYPVQVDDVESDVVVPERRPRSSSRATSPSSTRRSKDLDTSLKNKDDDTSGWESSEDAPIRKPKGRGKRRVRLRTRDRRLSEEATDSDAPRGSRDSDFEDNETSKRESRARDDNNKDYEMDTKSSQGKGAKRERRKPKNRDDMISSSQEKSKDTSKNNETSESAKRDGTKDRARSKLSTSVPKQQDEDSDDEGTHDVGTSRSRSRSSRLSELDLRKKSLTLNLNSTSSTRSANTDRDSPMADSISQDEDSSSCSEVFDESPQTETKTFQSRLGKRRRSQLDKLRHDKIQDEPWQWSGKNYQNKRKGKGRKVFYKTIVRGDETISVGDCAVFTSNPSKSNNLPYVGMIESMWEGCNGNMVVKVKWFYHPEETKAGRRASDAKQSLYRSTHVDENDVQTISHKCEVVSPEELKRRTQETIGTRSSTSDRSERLFCCVGTYDPSTEKIETT